MAKNSYKNLLANISQLNAGDAVTVYVPSIQNNLQFSPLTVKQQKQLLASSVDTEFENLSFMNTLSEIIISNCKSNSTLLLVDKPLIALQLRAHALGNVLTVDGDNQDKHAVDLEAHIKNVISSLTPIAEEPPTMTHGPVTITCRIPDLKKDIQYNKQFTKKVKKPGGAKLKMTDVIGDVYVSELVKFIHTVTVGEDMIDVDEGVSPAQVVDIFENLPMQVSSKLAEAVKTCRTIEEESITCAELPDGITIPIDASLFTVGE